MLKLIEFTVIIALSDAFFITLAYKWGIVEYLQVHADNWLYRLFRVDTSLLNQLFSCNFCMSWWLSWVFSLILLWVTKDQIVLASPVLATPISRILI